MFLKIYILTMFLAKALNNINLIEPRADRHEVLAETLKNPEKLAKTLLRIEFLTACRREKLNPRFIEEALRPIRKIFSGKDKIQSKCNTFAHSLLNEAIAEAHKRRAYLVRQRNRQLTAIRSFLDEDRLWYIHSKCEQIFNITIRENRPGLIQKFQRRRQEEAELRASNEETTSPAVQKRVRNLSTLALDSQGLDLLSKGPNFATTQQISKSVLMEAEKGVERLAYAIRWQDAIKEAKKKTNASAGSTTTSTTTDQRTPTSTDETSTSNPAEPPNSASVQAPTTADSGLRSSSAAPTPTPTTSTAPPIQGAVGQTTLVDASPANDGLETSTTSTDRQSARPRSDLSFRFPDTDKRFPPPSKLDVEQRLKILKEDIVRTYKNHYSLDKSNVSEDQLKFLKMAKKDDSVVFKQSDKCKGFVVMDKDVYLKKSHDILDDRMNYEIMDKNPVPKVEAETKRVFKSVAQGKLPESVVKELTPGHSRTPVFYGLPKDHKESVPLRPVISACGGPTEKTSCLLERILHQLLNFVPAHLWDTRDFLDRLKAHSEDTGITFDTIFFSIDVVNLYGSIPISEAIDAVLEKLAAHREEIDTFGLSHDDVRTLLRHCLEKNVFRFDDKFYRQTLGIAMGNPCAPPIAILFLDRFERQALENLEEKPSFFVRYIDDYAGLWTHGQQSLIDFVTHLNSLHPTLRFTLEHSGGGSGVPFLDTLVTVASDDNATKIETELFIKPTNSGIILHYKSAHPTATKHNIARNQFRRAIKNSSNSDKEKVSIDKIWRLLVSNGYPKKILQRLLEEVRRGGRAERAGRAGQKRCTDGFLSLPYIDEELLCKIQSKVRKSGFKIRIAWKNPKKLRNILIRSSLSKPQCPGGRRCNTCASGFKGDCTQTNVVYCLNCKMCDEGEQSTYIGETKRPVRLRFNEHVRDAVNKSEGTPMGDHFRMCHATDDVPHIPLQVNILYKSKDHPDRKIAESIMIRRNRPKLNYNLSSWPIM